MSSGGGGDFGEASLGYWRREGKGQVWYYYGPRGDADNSQLLTKAEWDAHQNRYERDEDGRRTSGGGRPESGEEDEGYKIETDLSTFDQVERVIYATGLWAEGIVKGAVLVLPPILLVAMTVGLTMGLIRVGVRGTEKFFPVRRKCN